MSGRSLHTEETNIAAFLQGTEDGFTSIFNRLYSPLCYFAFRLLKDKQAAEDLVQDSFVRLWNKRSNFLSLETVRAYLYKTIRFACIDHLNRTAKQNTEMHQFNPPVDKSMLIHLIEAEYIDELYKALLILPPECLKIIRMMYLQSMTAAEIATTLGISVSTVKTQKSRGLAALKKNLRTLYFSF